ncbi:MAG: HAMP domain-containing histidine kinase [Nitrospirota bacterium]|nr:HAMP domain-containing histidine kinase [Nitrospirota bacterium]
MKLKRKVLSSILLIALVPGIIGITLSLWVAKGIIYQNTGEVLQSVAQCYSEDVIAHFAPAGGSISENALADFFAIDIGMNHTKGEHLYHVDLVREDGTVLFDCLGDDNDQYTRDEMTQLSENTGWFSMSKHNIDFVSGYTKLPFSSNNGSNIFIVVGLHEMKLTEKLSGFFIKVALPSIIIITLMIAGLHHTTNRQLITPLKELYTGVEAVKDGKLDYHVEVKTGDEIQVLSEEFNSMVAKLNASREQLQEALIRDKKRASIGTLAAGIAHELNNPLTAVIGFTESIDRRLEKETIDREEIRRFTKKIQDSGWRCVKIIEALKSYARETSAERRDEDVNDIITSSTLLVAHQFQSWATIDIAQDLAEDLPPIFCERVRLQQVIINLLINARDVMPSGGTITIRSRRGDESALDGKAHIMIGIEDGGPGIEPDILPLIFDPFFTTKGVGEGTGLGLSICQGIIASHGGTISASNKTEGTGAVFTIRIPLEHNQLKVTFAKTDKFGDGIGMPQV